MAELNAVQDMDILATDQEFICDVSKGDIAGDLE